MRYVAHLALAAALAASSGSAFAAQSGGRDLAYRGESMLTEGMRHKPYWTLQARCSGFFGATSAYMAEKGDAAEADAAKAQGVAFFRDAVDRLVQDRKVTRDVAIASVAKIVDAGRTEGRTALEQGDRSTSAWNYTRSACLDVNDTYASLRKR